MMIVENIILNEFDLASASWRKATNNESSMIEALATRLKQALPSAVSIGYTFALQKKNRRVNVISVKLGDDEYSLAFSKKTGITTRVGKTVRGIVLKTESISFQIWLQKLNQSINQYAKEHQTTEDLLEQFLF